MASKKKPTPSASPAQPGSSERAKEVRPGEVPNDHTEAESDSGAVPLGLPISTERYEALQKGAKHRKLDRPDVTQEDPGTARDT